MIMLKGDIVIKINKLALFGWTSQRSGVENVLRKQRASIIICLDFLSQHRDATESWRIP